MEGAEPFVDTAKFDHRDELAFEIFFARVTDKSRKCQGQTKRSFSKGENEI
jgi:hypothetical protein